MVIGRATASPPLGTLETAEHLQTKIVPGAVTFHDREGMTRMSTASPVGTIAYVIEEEALLVRVNNGWQYIAVCALTYTSFEFGIRFYLFISDNARDILILIESYSKRIDN